MAAETDNCLPSWHATFAPLIGGAAEAILRSGCSVDSAGDVACSPETMRAKAEQQLQASGLWPPNKSLTLDVYALARNVQSEVGTGTPEERVALAESTINQAARRSISPAQLILLSKNKKGLFGMIGGGRGRFTDSRQDPSILATLIADFALSGQSRSFAKGADDQDGLEYRSSFPDPMARVRQYAKEQGRYWIGPLPGVDHWLLSLFAPYGYTESSPEGQALLQRAEQYFGNPKYSDGRVVADMRPVWTGLSVCGQEPLVVAQEEQPSPAPPERPQPQPPPVPPEQPTQAQPPVPSPQPAPPAPAPLPAPRPLPIPLPRPVPQPAPVPVPRPAPPPTVVQLPRPKSPARSILIGFAAVAGLSALGFLTYHLTAMRAASPVYGWRRRRYLKRYQ